jgi:hypothetical protein
MLFTEYAEPIELWRIGPPASGLRGDKQWSLITTISGRWEPVQGDEEFLNNQTFANVTELVFLPIEYKNIVKPNDGLVDTDGIQRKIVGVPEVWKYMLPAVVCKAERTQWTVVS